MGWRAPQRRGYRVAEGSTEEGRGVPCGRGFLRGGGYHVVRCTTEDGGWYRVAEGSTEEGGGYCAAEGTTEEGTVW